MIVCKDCGFRNDDKDTFCGSCGRFLEWTGEKVAVKVESPLVREAEQEAAQPRPGLLRRMQNAAIHALAGPVPDTLVAPGRGAGAAPRPPGAPGPPRPPAPPAAGPPAPPRPPAPPKPPPPPPPPAPPRPPAAAAPPPPPPAPPKPPAPPRPPAPPPPPAAAKESLPAPPSVAPRPPSPDRSPAMALVAPVDPRRDPPAAERVTEEVVPQVARTKVAPVRRTTATKDLRPGDRICGQCGTGNPPVRKFCARCGESLAAAEVVATPWWRRLVRRRAKTVKAGARPRKPASAKHRAALRQINRKIRTVLALVVLLGGVLYGLYPPFRGYVNDNVTAVKQKIFGLADSTLSPVHPSSIEANEQVAGHPGRLAVDEFTNTYWLAPWAGSQAPQAPTLTLGLAGQTILRKMIITIGASGSFTAQDRPAILQLLYSDQKTDFITLQDTSKPQQFTLTGGVGVTSVRIRVLEVFPAQGSTDVAITEIELFGIG